MTIERMNYPDGYFPEEEYLARWDKVQAEMRRCQYELAIVWGKTAGHYERAMETLWLTNFWSVSWSNPTEQPLRALPEIDSCPRSPHPLLAVFTMRRISCKPFARCANNN